MHICERGKRHSFDLLSFQSLQYGLWSFVCRKARKSNPMGKAKLKAKTVIPFFFSRRGFLGNLSYPGELLQGRQVVTLVDSITPVKS